MIGRSISVHATSVNVLPAQHSTPEITNTVLIILVGIESRAWFPHICTWATYRWSLGDDRILISNQVFLKLPIVEAFKLMDDTSVLLRLSIFLRGMSDYCNFPRIYSDVGPMVLSHLAPIIILWQYRHNWATLECLPPYLLFSLCYQWRWPCLWEMMFLNQVR